MVAKPKLWCGISVPMGGQIGLVAQGYPAVRCRKTDAGLQLWIGLGKR